MRNKIKQMMKKEEGFTLVELLAVIVILGVIVAIAIPTIGSVISTAETGASTAEQELVRDAARLYEVGEEDPEFPVTAKELKDAGYLDYRDSSTLKENEEAIKVQKDTNGNFEIIGYPPAE